MSVKTETTPRNTTYSHPQNDFVTDRVNAQRILALSSLLIPAILLLIFLIAPTASDLKPNPLVIVISMVIIFQATLRLMLNWGRALNDGYQLLCVTLDFVALAVILLAYAVTYDVPFAVALKSPTANIFFIYLTSRVILFNRAILLKTLIIACVIWACLVGVAVLDPMFEGRTSSYTEYMTSFKVLIGAEVERVLQFGFITAVLYVYLKSVQTDPPTGFLRRLFFLGTLSRFLISNKIKSARQRSALVEIRIKNVADVDKIYTTTFNLIPDLPILEEVNVVVIGRLSDQSVGLSIDFPKNEFELPGILEKIHADLNESAAKTLGSNAPTFIVVGCELDRKMSANRHLRYTDAAIREAMATGQSSLEFGDALLSKIENNQHIERAIKSGIEHEKLSVVYQPIIDLMTEKPVGFEALVRLKGEDNVPISPADFIPIAEKTGLIDCVTDYLCDKIAEEAIEIAHIFESRDVKPYINVNISPTQINDVNRVLKALKHAEEGGVKINIEITESTICDNTMAEKAFDALRGEGFSIAIDDFGTGYSSLQRLETLQFSTLKIDRSFVTHIDDPEGYNFLSAIISLARATAKYTIVEGVETVEQKILLMKMGVRYCQGFYWARPTDIGSLETYLAEEYGFHKSQPKGQQKLKAV